MGVQEEDEDYELKGLKATDVALLLANGLAGHSKVEKLTINAMIANSWVCVDCQLVLYSEITFSC